MTRTTPSAWWSARPRRVTRCSSSRTATALAILDVYGLTETGPITFNTYDQRRAGSMGVPVSWYEVRILDENDVEVPVGEPGEICIRPARPHVMMAGYWNNDSATMKSIRNLWFHTGDHGYRDADGFYFFKARETDSIRRRGENVSAWEVERVLALHDEVLESAVYGVPSPLGGQEVMAAIVLKPGSTLAPEALLDFCTERMAALRGSPLPALRGLAAQVARAADPQAGVEGRGDRGRRRVGSRVGRLQGPAMTMPARSPGSARRVPRRRGDTRPLRHRRGRGSRARSRVRCSCATRSPRSTPACGCGCARAVPPATSTRFR